MCSTLPGFLDPFKTIVFCVEVREQVAGVSFPQRTHLGHQTWQQASVVSGFFTCRDVLLGLFFFPFLGDRISWRPETPDPCARPKYKCVPYWLSRSTNLFLKVLAPLSGVKGGLQTGELLFVVLDGGDHNTNPCRPCPAVFFLLCC